MHGTDHHVVEHGRIVDVKLNIIDFAVLDRIQPFVAVHLERAGRARADQDEIGMDQRTQALHVLAAKGVAPLALEPLDQLAIITGHAFPLSPAVKDKDRLKRIRMPVRKCLRNPA